MEHETEDQALLRLTEAIADGTLIDWQREAEVAPHLRALIAHLQSVERLMTAHREVSERWATLHGEPQSTTPRSISSASEAEFVPEPHRWGDFELRERLAAGSFGEVFRARDPALQREVAPNLMHGEASSGSAAPVAEASRLAGLPQPPAAVR